MRTFICALLLAGACATTNTGANHPTNVAHVRLAIASAMKTQAPERTIAAMGKTTDDRAIVYTTSKTGEICPMTPKMLRPSPGKTAGRQAHEG